MLDFLNTMITVNVDTAMTVNGVRNNIITYEDSPDSQYTVSEKKDVCVSFCSLPDMAPCYLAPSHSSVTVGDMIPRVGGLAHSQDRHVSLLQGAAGPGQGDCDHVGQHHTLHQSVSLSSPSVNPEQAG